MSYMFFSKFHIRNVHDSLELFVLLGFVSLQISSMFQHLSSLSLPGTRKGPASRDSECGGWKDWQPGALQTT